MDGKKTVLIIDDDTGVVEALTAVLSHSEFIPASSDGGNILKTIKKLTPHIVLLDLNLKKADGREIFKIIRSSKEFNTLPIIVMSASHQTREVSQELGASGYIEKPFDIDAFLGLLHHHTS